LVRRREARPAAGKNQRTRAVRFVAHSAVVLVVWVVLAFMLFRWLLSTPGDERAMQNLISKEIPLGTPITRAIEILRSPPFVQFASSHHYSSYQICTGHIQSGCVYDDGARALLRTCLGCDAFNITYLDGVQSRSLWVWLVFGKSHQLGAFTVYSST
jgi:hypothetical protein